MDTLRTMRNNNQPQPQGPAPIQRLDADAIVTGRDLDMQGERMYRERVAPEIASAWEMAAGATQSAAKIQYAKEFEKYGPEIQGELQKLPPQMRTLDNISTVVTLVKGRHADEDREAYAREHAQRILTEMGQTIRPTGGGSSSNSPIQPNPFESDDVPADWKSRAKTAGITESTLLEFCRSNDMTPDAFWKLFPKGTALQPIVAEAGRGK